MTQNEKEIFETQNQLIAIDFSATWCGPCKKQTPIFDELKSEISSVLFKKIDIDNESDLTSKFNIKSIPTIVFVKNGKEIERMIGFQTKNAIQQKIDDLK
jgi:thioredoxin 1